MQLEELGAQHLNSFLDLVHDFAEGDKELFLEIFGDKTWDAKAFQKFVKDCEKERMDWRPKAGKTSVSHYVLTLGGQVRGYGRLRFPIDPAGSLGNLEFYVSPSHRKQGFGTHTLNKLLFEAVRAGLARALVVCRTDDEAAIRCIEHNRGEKIEEKNGKLSRYWIRFR